MMVQRHTLLFGTVLAVTGVAVAADHYSHEHQKEITQVAPAAPMVEREADAEHGSAVIEFSPCSASMEGILAVPAPAPVPAPAQEPEIIEFAPCAAGF